jgi:hypothetical protein
LLVKFRSAGTHFDPEQVIHKGQDKAGAGAEGFRNVESELNSLAAKLLENPGVHSRELEWALLDALVYAECIAFAQIIFSKTKMYGQRVPDMLKGAEPAKSVLPQLVPAIASDLRSYGIEALKIAATLAVSYVLAAENLSTAWVITTGVTLFRWLRPVLFWKELNPQVKERELLEKLFAIYRLLGHYDFNARQLREIVVSVSKDGIVFSRYVLNILDARIKREEA